MKSFYAMCLCSLILFVLSSSLALAGENRSYLPHFTNKTGEWETSIALTNPNSTSARMVLNAYDEEGQHLGETTLRLAPYAGLNQTLAELFGELSSDTGWLRLDSDRDNTTGLLTFRNVATNATTSLPLDGRSGTHLTLPLLENQADKISGLVLTNTSESLVNLTLTLSDLDSDAVYTSPQTLAAGAKLKGIAADFFEIDVPDRAWLGVAADGPITGFALTFQDDFKQIIAVPADFSDPGLLPELQSKLDGVFEAYQVPAMSAGVWAADKDPSVATNGKADLASDEALGPEHSANIGSITKVFTATLILMLEEEGKLSLSDPLSNWLSYPRADEVTLNMLLNHTSGIFNYTNNGLMWEEVNAALDNPVAIPPEDLLAYARTSGNGGYSFDPGSDWGYSNTNYILLGMIIEAIEGDLAQQLHARIFEPLGMSRSFLAGAEAVPGRAMQYIDDDGDPVEVSKLIHMSWAWAAGAIVSTPEDLMTFSRALFGGQLLTQTSLDKMTTPTGQAIDETTPTGQAIKEGYGLGLVIGKIEGQPAYFHGGGAFGGVALMGYLTDRGEPFATQITMAVENGELTSLIQATVSTLIPETSKSNERTVLRHTGANQFRFPSKARD